MLPQRIFQVSSKGTTLGSINASVPERSRDGTAMLSAKELREKERFRSFTTFSVFMRLKAKGKGILMRLVFYLSPSFSGTVVGTCTENPARATKFYLKCIWHPRLVLHLHEAYPPKCARILHVHAYISHLLSSWRTGRGHDNLLWPVFWKTKVWLALPKIEIHLHNFIL